MDGFTAGNVKAAMREHGAGSRDLWQVAPGDLRTMDGFNVRAPGPELDAHIRSIADSIKANGYYSYQPLGAVVAIEDGQQVIYVHAGHCRLAAVMLAIEEGATIERVPVVVSPAGTSMEDLTVELVRGNSGKSLSTYENALVCARLSRFGWDAGQIAKRLGYASAQYVDGLLSLASAPSGLRNMVIAGEVSATLAITTIARHGDKAERVLKAAAAQGEGKKVTAKAVAPTFAKQLRKEAPRMHDALRSLMTDPAFSRLAPVLRATVAGIIEGLGELPK